MAERAGIYKGPFRVVVYHNLGTYEAEWNYGDGDLAFEIEQATVIIGARVLCPDGAVFSAAHYNVMVAEEAEKINVNMDLMTSALARNLAHDEWIQEDLDGRQGSDAEGGRLGGRDPQGIGDRSDNDTSDQPDVDVQAGGVHDGDGGDTRP